MQKWDLRKFSTPCTVQTLNKLGVEGMYFSTIKAYMKNPQQTYSLMKN